MEKKKKKRMKFVCQPTFSSRVKALKKILRADHEI